MSHLGWRFIFWVIGIWALLCTGLVLFFLPETYHPKRKLFAPFSAFDDRPMLTRSQTHLTVLATRAKKLRKENPETTKELYADLERADFSFKSLVSRTLARPFVMLATEPILMLVTIYLSIM